MLSDGELGESALVRTRVAGRHGQRGRQGRQHSGPQVVLRQHPSTDSEAASLATRERQARNLQDFKGGGVTIYIGSGVLLIVLIILLILLI